MSIAIINGGEKPITNQEELATFLAAYKVKNPAKFAAKKANGEFEKLRRSLPDFKEELKEAEVKEKEPVEEPKKKKSVKT